VPDLPPEEATECAAEGGGGSGEEAVDGEAAAAAAAETSEEAAAATRVTGDALKAARTEFESLRPSLWRQEAATNRGRYSPSQLANMQAG
jgi:hypothetical protein